MLEERGEGTDSQNTFVKEKYIRVGGWPLVGMPVQRHEYSRASLYSIGLVRVVSGVRRELNFLLKLSRPCSLEARELKERNAEVGVGSNTERGLKLGFGM